MAELFCKSLVIASTFSLSDRFVVSVAGTDGAAGVGVGGTKVGAAWVFTGGASGAGGRTDSCGLAAGATIEATEAETAPVVATAAAEATDTGDFATGGVGAVTTGGAGAVTTGGAGAVATGGAGATGAGAGAVATGGAGATGAGAGGVGTGARGFVVLRDGAGC